MNILIAARQWNHIEDLDDFFTRVYHYHQRNGFVCMVLQDVMQLMYVVQCLLVLSATFCCFFQSFVGTFFSLVCYFSVVQNVSISLCVWRDWTEFLLYLYCCCIVVCMLLTSFFERCVLKFKCKWIYVVLFAVVFLLRLFLHTAVVLIVYLQLFFQCFNTVFWTTGKTSGL